MYTSHATLFYGIWVNFASLNFAAQAHKATRAPLLGVDLILQRRRKGLLYCEGEEQGEKTVRDLPEEVWGMVRRELLGAEVRKAEWATLAQYRCEDCDEDERKRSQRRGRKKITRRWSRWTGPLDCDSCWDNILSSDPLNQRSAEELEMIRQLLASYRLELPFGNMWSEDPRAQPWDRHALSAIALPRRSSSQISKAWPQTSAECVHEHGAGTGVVNFSPEALVVFPSDHLQFRRLISDYRLEVADRTEDTIITPSQAEQLAEERKVSTEQTKSSLEGQQSPVKRDDEQTTLEVTEPRWMLLTLCDTCA